MDTRVIEPWNSSADTRGQPSLEAYNRSAVYLHKSFANAPSPPPPDAGLCRPKDKLSRGRMSELTGGASFDRIVRARWSWFMLRAAYECAGNLTDKRSPTTRRLSWIDPPPTTRSAEWFSIIFGKFQDVAGEPIISIMS